MSKKDNYSASNVHKGQGGKVVGEMITSSRRKGKPSSEAHKRNTPSKTPKPSGADRFPEGGPYFSVDDDLKRFEMYGGGMQGRYTWKLKK